MSIARVNFTVSNSPSSEVLSLSNLLAVFTSISARELDCRKAAERTLCSLPYYLVNCFKWYELNSGPLSLVSNSWRPKSLHSRVSTLTRVLELPSTVNTWNQLENLSTTTPLSSQQICWNWYTGWDLPYGGCAVCGGVILSRLLQQRRLWRTLLLIPGQYNDSCACTITCLCVLVIGIQRFQKILPQRFWDLQPVMVE